MSSVMLLASDAKKNRPAETECTFSTCCRAGAIARLAAVQSIGMVPKKTNQVLHLREAPLFLERKVLKTILNILFIKLEKGRSPNEIWSR